MRAHGTTLGCRRVSEDMVQVAERGVMLKERMRDYQAGFLPPKLSHSANHLMQDFPGFLMTVKSEGEAQDKTRQMVSQIGYNR